MSLMFNRMMVYAFVTVLMLMSHCYVKAAPNTWPEKSMSDQQQQQQVLEDKAAILSVLQALYTRLHDTDRAKRGRADGGFLSRHDAMSDYLQSFYAKALAMDPYGPGRRK